MNTFLQEKSVLQHLEKARDRVKLKYSRLRQNKADFEKRIGDTFKPIVDPLEKLIAQTSNGGIKRKKVSYSKQEEEDEDEEEGDNNDETLNRSLLDRSLEDDTVTEAADTSFETAGSEDEESPEIENTYLNVLSKKNVKKDLDLIYGVRKSGQNYMIGNTPIYFKKQLINVNNKNFPKTNGLLELLFKKDPSKKLVSESDSQNYRAILETSNAHKKQHDLNGDIRRSNSKKFHDIISPLFNLTDGQKTGSGFLPSYKVAKIESLTDYVYWDDPNELVDRLRLLIAESQAGNPSHINEIHSIIEELRESGYIY